MSSPAALSDPRLQIEVKKSRWVATSLGKDVNASGFDELGLYTTAPVKKGEVILSGWARVCMPDPEQTWWDLLPSCPVLLLTTRTLTRTGAGGYDGASGRESPPAAHQQSPALH